ncbi:MAG: carboxypeptidase-like regulatory domain-containing protein [Saprospiraceae bacterium]
MKQVILFLLFCFAFVSLSAQQKFTLSGYLKDAASGETLIGANVYNAANPAQGTSSNAYGFYSLTLAEGSYEFVFSYLGYTEKTIRINLTADQRLNLELVEGITITEVVVTAKEADENVESTEMGTIDLSMENVKRLPALLGEVDILKTLQLLPGVASAGEGNAGFYVRGGGPDQNLVLLDEAVVYNSGHMLGFFSVFNADAIKNTTLIKGGMPANYGGRLSSVVDIQMKEGNNKHFAVEGGIGLIASRLTVEGPIQKDKSSFIVSARRTYAFDLAQPALKGTDFEGTNYYFYDLNTKINYRFSDKDRLYLSGYFGRDVLNYVSNLRGFFFNLPYGNATATLRWNHLFSDKLFMNVSAIYNDYDFSFEGGQDQFKINVVSGVRDYNAKIDFDYFPSNKHNLKFGANYTFHRLTPNIANATSGEVEFETTNLQKKYAHEAALYLLDDYKVTDRLRINYGIRASIFTQVGPFESAISNRSYDRGEPVKTYYGLAPRVTGKYSINERVSLKAGVTVTNQFVHLVSNSTSTLPTDVWVPSSERVRPQRGIQYALGYFQNLKDNVYETSVEIYYKDLWDQIDYPDTYVSNPTQEADVGFVFGEGRSYGIELFLRKNKGKLTGWIGYTLSRTERSFPDIEDGRVFAANYDRTHDLSVVGNYRLNDKWEFGGALVFGTGNAFTPIKSLFLIEQNLNVEYGPRNSARLENYHRIDLSATYTPNPKSQKNFRSSWVFSIYNIYNRRNPFFTYTAFETNLQAGSAKATAYKVSLFPIIPSVTWNFKWQQKKKK